MPKLTESVVEEAALSYFADLGYAYRHGSAIDPESEARERAEWSDVVLRGRLAEAIDRLNPRVPADARAEALRRVLHLDEPTLLANNHTLHRWLVEGIPVEVARKGGEVGYVSVRLLDFERPGHNDLLVVNQLTVDLGAGKAHRPDIVVYVNGLPLGVIELKNPTDEQATLAKAFTQLQTYQSAGHIGSLFHYNSVLVVADGTEARIGSLTAGFERFLPWRTIEGEEEAPRTSVALEILIKGVFEPSRLLDLVRDFTLFERNGDALDKKIAAYHQFHAVRRAVSATTRAIGPKGDRRIGIVWHTQGSGKSLTMVFYAGKIIQHPALENPTIVVLTDRNDLDGQLFRTFAACSELLRQAPKQAGSREEVRELLKVAAGGVIFTTIQKFAPDDPSQRHEVLSTRRNIVIIADEAHRSQYGIKGRTVANDAAGTAYLAYGFAKHLRDALPNASFIAFTGTPIELEDRSTTSTFGNYISIYDIQQAVADGATVPIYYENRIAKLEMPPELRTWIDEEFEEVTEGEEEDYRHRLKTKWAALEAIVGAAPRIDKVAADLVAHFDARNKQIPGKAMIVCMSRRICALMYNAIVKLRPEWEKEERIKVVITGSASDNKLLQPHIRSKGARDQLAKDFRDEDHDFQIALVRDMWLTGFDAPSLHTLYVDKPMQGHALAQAIARVNRVFRDKPGGLVVDYLGIAESLRAAVRTYTRAGGRGTPAEELAAEALPVLLKEYEVCKALFHGFDYSRFFTGTPAQRLAVLPAAQEHVLAQERGKERFVDAVTRLTRANALCGTLDEAQAIADEVAFFQGIKACMVKSTRGPGKHPDVLDAAIKQIIDNALISDEVIDIFSAAGIERPNLSILSDEFLDELRHNPHPHVTAELLRKLLSDEIKAHARINLIKSRKFSAMLDDALKRYHSRAVTSHEVIQELIDLAKDLREDAARGAALNLSAEEIAFYDALAENGSARDLLGEPILKRLAHELVLVIRNNVTIDWQTRDNVRAHLRRLVKRLLRKYKYPPDLQEKATETVIKQAELLAESFAA